MISYIKGKIIKKLSNSIIIETNNLGYEVFLSHNYPGIVVDSQIELYTYLQVREDAWNLYGFLSWEEREFFMLLISISGIGPKLGMSIISNSTLNQLKNSIATSDMDSLIQIPGIGKKTAQRIIMELKDKIGDYMLPEADQVQVTSGYSVTSENSIAEALQALGYHPVEIRKVLPQVYKNNEDAGETELIKKALQLLAKL